MQLTNTRPLSLQTLSSKNLSSHKNNPQREVVLQTDSILWRRHEGLLEQVCRAADVAMEFFMMGYQKRPIVKQQRWSVTILCTTDRRMRELNKRFRGKDAPCDSIAFPECEQGSGRGHYASIDSSINCQNYDTNRYPNRYPSRHPSRHPSRYLGDIALGYQGLQRKVVEYQLDAQAHCAHITAHAIAHLVGLNHQTIKERDIMETAEEEILRRLGLPESSPCSGLCYEKKLGAQSIS